MQVSILLQAKGSEVVTVGPGAPTAEVVGVLAERRIGAVVVSGDGRHVDGVLSERDVVTALAGHGADALAEPARRWMSSPAVTCEPDTTVEWLMATMTERRVRHVPVLVDGELAGLVSIGDVVKDHVSALEAETQVLHDYIANPY
ncbi:MAG: CBS domain-containing protein [Acidimicrobiales bacterium]